MWSPASETLAFAPLREGYLVPRTGPGLVGDAETPTTPGQVAAFPVASGEDRVYSIIQSIP